MYFHSYWNISRPLEEKLKSSAMHYLVLFSRVDFPLISKGSNLSHLKTLIGCLLSNEGCKVTKWKVERPEWYWKQKCHLISIPCQYTKCEIFILDIRMVSNKDNTQQTLILGFNLSLGRWYKTSPMGHGRYLLTSISDLATPSHFTPISTQTSSTWIEPGPNIWSKHLLPNHKELMTRCPLTTKNTILYLIF